MTQFPRLTVYPTNQARLTWTENGRTEWKDVEKPAWVPEVREMQVYGEGGCSWMHEVRDGTEYLIFPTKEIVLEDKRKNTGKKRWRAIEEIDGVLHIECRCPLHFHLPLSERMLPHTAFSKARKGRTGFQSHCQKGKVEKDRIRRETHRRDVRKFRDKCKGNGLEITYRKGPQN